MRRIFIDASYKDGWAGVAAVLQDRDCRPLFADVVKIDGSRQAEELALLKAMRIARDSGWTAVTFMTDCADAKRTWIFGPTIKPERHPDWRLEVVERRKNSAAHTLSREAMKIWHAGNQGVPTQEDEDETTV